MQVGCRIPRPPPCTYPIILFPCFRLARRSRSRTRHSIRFDSAPGGFPPTPTRGNGSTPSLSRYHRIVSVPPYRPAVPAAGGARRRAQTHVRPYPLGLPLPSPRATRPRHRGIAKICPAPNGAIQHHSRYLHRHREKSHSAPDRWGNSQCPWG